MAVSPQDIFESWNRFHQEALLAANYRMVPRPHEIRNDRIPNPLLDSLLPSILHLRVVSILDEALELYIDDNEIRWPPEKKRDLFNRITMLGEQGVLRDIAECNRIRDKRNKLAHEAGEFATWDDLHKCVDSVEVELRNLGYVSDRPRYSWYAETGVAEGSSDQSRITLSYGLRGLSGRSVVEVTWTELKG